MICRTPDLRIYLRGGQNFPAVYFKPFIAGTRRFAEPDMEIEKSLTMEMLYLDTRRLN